MGDWHSIKNSDGKDLAWRELQPFGVEVRGDLSAPLSHSASEQFTALFRNHGLIIAHKQDLSMERQRELLSLLGPILLRKGESGYLSNEGEHDAVRSGLSFHADGAYTEQPFDAIALHAVDVVDGASSTRFVSSENALNQLPSSVKQKLADCDAEMISPGTNILADRVCDIENPEAMKEGVRPAILTNPGSGRQYLNLSEMHTKKLCGMEWAESRNLLHTIFDALYAPQNIYEHVWQQGDIVIWDNQALQHARGSLKNSGRRVLQRVIVGTDGEIPMLGRM